jgi:hypothetical protein
VKQTAETIQKPEAVLEDARAVNSGFAWGRESGLGEYHSLDGAQGIKITGSDAGTLIFASICEVFPQDYPDESKR